MLHFDCSITMRWRLEWSLLEGKLKRPFPNNVLLVLLVQQRCCCCFERLAKARSQLNACLPNPNGKQRWERSALWIFRLKSSAVVVRFVGFCISICRRVLSRNLRAACRSGGEVVVVVEKQHGNRFGIQASDWSSSRSALMQITVLHCCLIERQAHRAVYEVLLIELIEQRRTSRLLCQLPGGLPIVSRNG